MSAGWPECRLLQPPENTACQDPRSAGNQEKAEWASKPLPLRAEPQVTPWAPSNLQMPQPLGSMRGTRLVGTPCGDTCDPKAIVTIIMISHAVTQFPCTALGGSSERANEVTNSS